MITIKTYIVVYHFILTDSEFNAMVGSWPDRCHDLDRYNLFPNSNKFDKCDSDVMLHSPSMKNITRWPVAMRKSPKLHFGVT